jgi:AhpD family alkylhydroperoxidase
MGELIGVVDTRGATIAGNARLQERVQIIISGNFTHLCSFCVDNHKYVQADACGYDKCNFSHNLEAEVPFKIMNEEINT